MSGLKNIILGNYLLSHAVARVVPSAFGGLTSLFGMGRGVPPRLLLPRIKTYKNNFGRAAESKANYPGKNINKVKSHDLLVLLGSTHCWAYTCSLSTW